MLPTHYIYPDSSRMRRQLSSHFCQGKVPLCMYCSVHIISFLPRHPAGIYPLECLFLSQLMMGCVTCHTCHGCVTHFRPILGNIVEVTLMTFPILYIVSHTKGTSFP